MKPQSNKQRTAIEERSVGKLLGGGGGVGEGGGEGGLKQIFSHETKACSSSKKCILIPGDKFYSIFFLVCHDLLALNQGLFIFEKVYAYKSVCLYLVTVFIRSFFFFVCHVVRLNDYFSIFYPHECQTCGEF